MTRKLYQELTHIIGAYKRCVKNNNPYADKWDDALRAIESNVLPLGSGIDCGTKIDRDASHSDRLVLTFSFHHVDSNGSYDGWTDYKAIVTPSLQFGYYLRIAGRDKNAIKDYLYQTFDYILTAPITPTDEGYSIEWYGHTQTLNFRETKQ